MNKSFCIHVGNLWQANTNVQFIFDLHVVVNYCTFYLTKIDKTWKKKLKTKLKKILPFEKWEMFFLMLNKC
jgi:hypothetical protein